MKLSIITISLYCDEDLNSTIKSIRSIIENKSSPAWEFEHILVSPDVRCEKYCNDYTVFIRRKKNGIYDAMNTGLYHFSGDFVIFINAGDKLLNLEPFFRIHQLDVKYGIYGFSVLENSAKGPVRCPRHTSPHQSTIYSRAAIQGMEFDINLKITADRDLFDRCRERGVRVFFDNEPISIFMTDGVSSVKRTFNERWFEAVYEIKNRRISVLRLWRFLRTLIG